MWTFFEPLYNAFHIGPHHASGHQEGFEPDGDLMSLLLITIPAYATQSSIEIPYNSYLLLLLLDISLPQGLCTS